MVLGLSNCCLQLYFSLFCYFTCCRLFLSWGATVLWRYSCGSCLGPSAHIVSFALEAQYGRSPPCFNGRLLAGLFSSQEIQAAVWTAGKYARKGGGTGRKKIPSFYFQCDTLGVRVYVCLWVFTHVNMHASLRWSSESNCALKNKARPANQIQLWDICL